MIGLWIIIAGVIIYVGSGFIPWTALTNFSFTGKAESAGTIMHIHGSGQFDEPWVFNMWQTLVVGFGANFWSTLLWLTPMCIAAILVLTILQLARQRTTKARTLSVFILSLVAFLPIIMQILILLPPEEMLAAPILSGFIITLVGLFLVILGSTLSLFEKHQIQARF